MKMVHDDMRRACWSECTTYNIDCSVFNFHSTVIFLSVIRILKRLLSLFEDEATEYNNRCA